MYPLTKPRSAPPAASGKGKRNSSSRATRGGGEAGLASVLAQQRLAELGDLGARGPLVGRGRRAHHVQVQLLEQLVQEHADPRAARQNVRARQRDDLLR